MTTMQNSHEEEHASEGTYFTVFGALAALTVIELVVVYLPLLRLPILLGLSAAKAWLVVEYFMHVRYDKRGFRFIFLIPVLTGVLIAILLTPLSVGSY